MSELEIAELKHKKILLELAARAVKHEDGQWTSLDGTSGCLACVCADRKTKVASVLAINRDTGQIVLESNISPDLVFQIVEGIFVQWRSDGDVLGLRFADDGATRDLVDMIEELQDELEAEIDHTALPPPDTDTSDDDVGIGGDALPPHPTAVFDSTSDEDTGTTVGSSAGPPPPTKGAKGRSSLFSVFNEPTDDTDDKMRQKEKTVSASTIRSASPRMKPMMRAGHRTLSAADFASFKQAMEQEERRLAEGSETDSEAQDGEMGEDGEIIQTRMRRPSVAMPRSRLDALRDIRGESPGGLSRGMSMIGISAAAKQSGSNTVRGLSSKQKKQLQRAGSINFGRNAPINVVSDWNSDQWVDQTLNSMPDLVNVDRGLLNNHDLVIRELFTSEFRYKLRLGELVKAAKAAQEKVRIANELRSKKDIQTGKYYFLSEAEFKSVFANVEPVQRFSDTLCDQLKLAVSDYDPSLFVSDDPIKAEIKSAEMAEKVGKMLVHLTPFFRVYTLYCNSYDSGARILVRCKEERPMFADFLVEFEEVGERSHGQSLSSLLISPVQRPPRIQLMLEQLLKHLKSHLTEVRIDLQDADEASVPQLTTLRTALKRAKQQCQDAFDQLSDMLGGLNVQVGIASEQSRLQVLVKSGQFDEGLSGLVAPHRTLAWDGPVRCEIMDLDICYAVVFSDVLLMFVYSGLSTDQRRRGKKEQKKALNRKGTFKKSNRATSTESSADAHPLLKRVAFMLPLEQVWVEKIDKKNEEDPVLVYLTTPDFRVTVHPPEVDDAFKVGEDTAEGRLRALDISVFYQAVVGAQGSVLRQVTNKQGQRQFRHTFKNPDNLSQASKGDSYDGKWADAVMDGRGRLVTEYGHTFNGVFSKSLAHDKRFRSEWRIGGSDKTSEIKDESDADTRARRRRGKAVYHGPYVNNLPQGLDAKYSYPGLGSYTGGFNSGTMDTTVLTSTGSGSSESGSSTKGMGKVTWESKLKYRGQVVDGMLHGRGAFSHTAVSLDGAYAIGSDSVSFKYSGGVHRSLNQGTGRLNLSSGHTYIGAFKNGVPHGLGEQHTPDQCLYRGEFVWGCRQGRGTFETPFMKYEGQFANDQFNGHGRVIMFVAEKFRGKKGRKSIGKLTMNSSARRAMWATGSRTNLKTIRTEVRAISLPAEDCWKTIEDWIATGGFIEIYAGQFQNGLRHGHGTLTQADGTAYVGSWRNGLRHGQGTQAYPNGDIYEGEWRSNLREGEGTMTYHSHSVNGNEIGFTAKYVGQWQLDMRHGDGMVTLRNGDSYNGDWENDVWHGKGTFAKADMGHAFSFRGRFQHGRRQGRGVQYDDSTGTFTGKWDNDVRHGPGILQLTTGEKREVAYHHGRLHGPGLYSFPGGDELRVEFKHGERIRPTDSTDRALAVANPNGARQQPPEFPLPPESWFHVPV